MFPLDYLDGSFDSFETTVTKDKDGFFVAEACGYSARAADQEQAVNDLNNLLMQKMETGELVPQNGN